jgi:hypothetical protein
MSAAMRRADEPDPRAEHLEVVPLGDELTSAFAPGDPPRTRGTRRVLRNDAREAQPLAAAYRPSRARALEMHQYAILRSTPDPEDAVADNVRNAHAPCMCVPADERPQTRS